MNSILKKVQVEHEAWQLHNFGFPSVVESLIGITEELGELSHAYLKNRQGIRLNENHEEKMKDAVGDLLIYLIAFCEAKGFDLEDILQKTWDEVRQRDWIKFPNNGKTE
jgi:NTP pyrophosphatase (non-canonical NTP hydrolase)